MKIARLLSLLAPFTLAFAAASGCSSPVKLTNLSFESDQWTGTAALLNYTLETKNASILQLGCTLALKSVSRQPLAYEVHLDALAHFVIFEAPAAQYEVKELRCSDGTKWVLTDFLKGRFSVAAGKINFLGLTRFIFSPQNKDLTVTEGAQKETTAALSEDLKILPRGWSGAFFNPFTEKPITTDMLVAESAYNLDVHARSTRKKGDMGSFNPSQLVGTLRACDLEEQHRFPYRIGTIRTTAVYKDGDLQSLIENGRDSFSDGFTACIESALRNLKPQSALEITLKL
jgi:hypothetical protein